MAARAQSRNGFTLIETMAALTVVAFASVGAVTGLLGAERELRSGQQRQAMMVLIDARTQQLLLGDKTALATGAAGLPAAVDDSSGTPPDSLAIGSAPWVPDPSPLKAGELGTGAYFRIDGSGQITPLDTSAIAPGTPCDQVPEGTFCREVLVTKELPAATGGITLGGTAIGDGDNAAAIPSDAQPYTVWIRIARKGDPLSKAVVERQLVMQ